MAKSVIETLQDHRTRRLFTDEPVSDDQLAEIITMAQRMPTSQYLQAYSLIEIIKPALRQQLAEITTMPTVGEHGRLFVVLADQHRNVQLAPGATTRQALSEFDRFVGSIEDATLMTAAMVMVAESLGLGTVVLGSINNDTQAVIDALKLPDLTLPVFGLQLGHPADVPEVKPRLGLSAVLFKDQYAEPTTYQDELTRFDGVLNQYYQHRSSHARTEHLAHMTAEATHSAAKRREFLNIARRQGFLPELDH